MRKAYSIFYMYRGRKVSAAQGTFATRELANRAIEHISKNRPWWSREEIASLFVKESDVDGEPYKPMDEYNGSPVFNWDYFMYDSAEAGDLVISEIAEAAGNAVPPIRFNDNVIQCGEPVTSKYDDRTGNIRHTYSTFVHVAKGIWKYCGDCFAGETVQAV